MVKGVFGAFLTNHSQFPGIQPHATTVGAFIDLDLPALAEKVTHHYDVRALGAIPPPFKIHQSMALVIHLQERSGIKIQRVADFGQFKIIEPNTSTATFANIHCYPTGRHRREPMITCWTIHKYPSNPRLLHKHAQVATGVYVMGNLQTQT